MNKILDKKGECVTEWFSTRVSISAVLSTVITVALFWNPIQNLWRYSKNPHFFEVGDKYVKLPSGWFVVKNEYGHVLVEALPALPLPFQQSPFVRMVFKKRQPDTKIQTRHNEYAGSSDTNGTIQKILDGPLCAATEDGKTECIEALGNYMVIAHSSLDKDGLLSFFKDIGVKNIDIAR